MGTGPQRRKRKHAGDKPMKEKYCTKRKTKDYDEIQHDMKPGNAEKLLTQAEDDDVPGSGKHYCFHCARHFMTDQALKDHIRGKPHKKRVKILKTTAWTQADAERAAGMGSFKSAVPFNTDLPTTSMQVDSPAPEPSTSKT